MWSWDDTDIPACGLSKDDEILYMVGWSSRTDDDIQHTWFLLRCFAHLSPYFRHASKHLVSHAKDCADSLVSYSIGHTSSGRELYAASSRNLSQCPAP